MFCTPLALTPEELSEAGRATSRDLQVQARLQPGVSAKQAQSAMDTLAANLAAAYPDADKGWGIKVEPLHAAYHRQMETPLLLMSASRPVCVAHRLRQRRQPLADACDRPKTRIRHSRGHRGQSPAARHPVADRKRPAGNNRRCAGASSRIRRRPYADAGDGSLSPLQRAERKRN